MLMGVELLCVVITYDIICQWSKNFRKCMQNYPENMRIPETTEVGVAIPGWHINGHGEGCRTNFNLSYMEGAGRTVGEDIETTWAGTNQLAPSVREMGPAARHDTLNDQWNGWNFRKIVGFRMSFFWKKIHLLTQGLLVSGTLFLKCFKDAFTLSTQQAEVFNQFSATFTPSAVKKWEEMVIAWNANPKARNPYQDWPSGLLPSSLPPHIRALPELKEICNLELQLRRPQADDALANVRRQRCVIQGLWLFKRLNVSGTGNRPNTCMISLYKCFNDKTDRAAEKW